MEHRLPSFNERSKHVALLEFNAFFIDGPVKEGHGGVHDCAGVLEADGETLGVGVVSELSQVGDGVGRCEVLGETAAPVVVAIDFLRVSKDSRYSREE